MYTALEKMKEKNISTYGIEGPEVPEPIDNVRINTTNGEKYSFDVTEQSQLELRSIQFIRDRCEELRFDPEHQDLNDTEGTSLKENQIPFNMEKDIDRLCLETAIHRFLETGMTEDAFDIYYIFLEMFVGKYSKTKRMIEKLSEFESNASSLLMSHRDHFSHSVYVFLIGLAIYDSIDDYRNTYNSFYNITGKAAAHHFLKYWGLSSLFHDIGYPFELPFEEVMSYFDKTQNDFPYISYKNINKYIFLKGKDNDKALILTEGAPVENLTEILALNINKRLGAYYSDRSRINMPGMKDYESYSEYLNKVFEMKPQDSSIFGNPDRPLGYMDHAYFSAVILMRNLFDILSASEFDYTFADVFSAITLHNSLFKHIVQNQKSEDNSFNLEKHAIHSEWHPLAYLLMLCDEIQCWDRTSYGQTSRTEVHAIGCDFDFGDNRIVLKYKFDKAMEEKANRKNEYGECIVGGTYRKMTRRSEGGSIKFLHDIEEIVSINREGGLTLTVETEFADNLKYRKIYLSNSNYMHLYDFAVILAGRNKYNISNAGSDSLPMDDLQEEFEKMSLEYKMMHIDRVKKFSKYLDSIDCFYSDRDMAYPLMTNFTEKDMDIIGPMEHERWLWNRHTMGWKFDDKYMEYPKEEQSVIRELTRTHKLMLINEEYTHNNAVKHYQNLSKKEQDKDIEPMNKLLYLLSLMDGVKFYRMSSWK